MDSSGNVYATGSTYSPTFSNGQEDAVVFMFDSTATFKYGRFWGSTLIEVGTGIALDSSEVYFYICGYSNSVGTLSIAEYDVFVIKWAAATGLVQWAQRFGYNYNDFAYGIYEFSGSVYVTGYSDSTGWAGANNKTDILLLKIYTASATTEYGKFIGGSQEDSGIKIIVDTDGSIYTLGQGLSVELTFGT